MILELLAAGAVVNLGKRVGTFLLGPDTRNVAGPEGDERQPRSDGARAGGDQAAKTGAASVGDESGPRESAPDESPPDESPPDESPPDEIEGEIKTLDRYIGMALGGTGVTLLGRLGVPAVPVLAIPLLVVPMVPLFQQTWTDLRERKKLGLGALETLATGSVIAIGRFAMAGVGLATFLGGQRMLLMTRRRAHESLESAYGEWQGSVWLVRDGIEVEVPLEAVQRGDVIAVGAGRPVPVDGELIEGLVVVDERAFTGESQLAERAEGDWLRAASLVVSGRGRVRAHDSGSDTMVARLSTLIAETASYEQEVELRSETMADRSVVPTLAASGLGAARWGLSGGIGVIWANCTDIVWLSAPASMLRTLRGASDKGILIKDGRSLDLLEDIDTIVFDKTGTLTLDSFSVERVHAEDGYDAGSLLQLAAAAECAGDHPIARAVISAAEAAGGAFRTRVADDPEYKPGLGLNAVVGGRRVVLGSRRLLARAGIPVSPGLEDRAAGLEASGHSVVQLALDGKHVGMIELLPEVRPEVRDVLAELRGLGLDVIILTGDEEEPTRRLAEALEITTWFSGTLPDEKQERIAELQRQGRRVCFVGDGVNDALAMRRAQVSISLAGASAVAVDSAQIVLQDGSLSRLVDVLAIGGIHRTVQGQLLAASLGPTVIAMGGVLMVGVPIGATLAAYGAGMTVSLGLIYRQERTLRSLGRDDLSTSAAGLLGP